jgi:hypothetical protein
MRHIRELNGGIFSVDSPDALQQSIDERGGRGIGLKRYCRLVNLEFQVGYLFYPSAIVFQAQFLRFSSDERIPK